MYQFKGRDYEIKDISLYLGNISKDFVINNLKKKTESKVKVKCFSDDFPIDTSNILDIDTYLMKGT